MSHLDSITLVRVLPCMAYPGKIIVTGKPSRPLDEVTPYLATLPAVIAYNPRTRALTMRRHQGFITIYTDEIHITQVEGTDEGLLLLEALKDAINSTWEHRDELTAATEQRRAPRHLDIYALLPQTNCKRCGEATCLAFAVVLIQGKRTLDECLPLRVDPAFTDRRAALEAVL